LRRCPGVGLFRSGATYPPSLWAFTATPAAVKMVTISGPKGREEAQDGDARE
jgi:hypothetical protein